LLLILVAKESITYFDVKFNEVDSTTILGMIWGYQLTIWDTTTSYINGLESMIGLSGHYLTAILFLITGAVWFMRR